MHTLANAFASVLLVLGGHQLPHDPPHHPPSRPPAPAPVAAADREVTFVVDGTTTYGTVHVPRHRAGQHLPAALLLPGSGPTDRNGDQPAAGYTPHTLAYLADQLGAQGIMSLRFDKYGTGETGLGAYTGRISDFDYAAQVRQAVAAYRLLAGQPEADRRALSVLGHSEGGLTALLVAESGAPRPAGVGLLQPLDERFLDLVRLQLGEALDGQVVAGTISVADAATNKAGIDRATAQFRAGQPVDVTGLLPGIAAALNLFFGQVNGRYTRSIDAIDPSSVASRLRSGTRVLVTCGTADPQVPCSTAPALVRALHRAGTGGPGLVVLPGVDHDLRAGTAAQGLAPVAVAALRAFTAPWREPWRGGPGGTGVVGGHR
ncbi:alpha/beta hydrolase family protein [Rugosimonospora africana]|uniref:Alpha/beta hydrolase n=1 Tax=Rugosimonospora africana TaxID=556532 RepID=A0A8J3QW94_9ACTN|nr:prolyl oligopeptidase family serine peptidase [Rugosimonospora africana]GIH18600.1 alpha/beta hydrolase [Rugosimonospora africana]